jgi:hypothetical protein
MRFLDRTDHAAWLAVGHVEGVVSTWDVETRRCISSLDVDKNGLENNPRVVEIAIARDVGRVVAWDDNIKVLNICGT